MLHSWLTVLVVGCLAAPAIASAQALVIPAPLPVATPPPVRLFKSTLAEPRVSPLAIQSENWWEPPEIGSDIPRWRIGYMVKANTPGGFDLSAGFVARQGDPLPLYLSEGSAQRVPSNGALDGPGSYRLQWDAKFAVGVPLWKRPKLKLDGIGEVFLPFTPSRHPSDTFLKSRAVTFKVAAGF